MSSEVQTNTATGVGFHVRGACTSIEEIGSALRTYVSENIDPMQCEEANPRTFAHRAGECYGRLNGRQPIFALLGYHDIQTLEGRLLTIVDASFTDREQRKAVKDLIRNAVWVGWVPNLDTDQPTMGIPDRS